MRGVGVAGSRRDARGRWAACVTEAAHPGRRVAGARGVGGAVRRGPGASCRLVWTGLERGWGPGLGREPPSARELGAGGSALT